MTCSMQNDDSHSKCTFLGSRRLPFLCAGYLRRLSRSPFFIAPLVFMPAPH